MSGKSRKKGGSVRNRVAALQKKDENGAERPVEGGATVPEDTNDAVEETVTDDTTEPKRMPATEAAYLAAELHEAKRRLLVMRNEVLGKAKQLVQKDQIILQREQTILQLETKIIEQENKLLRAAHGLDFGRTIHKDDVTGEVYYLESGASE
jgi:hypothetical protein